MVSSARPPAAITDAAAIPVRFDRARIFPPPGTTRTARDLSIPHNIIIILHPVYTIIYRIITINKKKNRPASTETFGGASRKTVRLLYVVTLL